MDERHGYQRSQEKAAGIKFNAYRDNPPLKRPYLTRNGHLGHFASQANAHYFEADQLYNLKTDPAEKNNVFDKHPKVAAHMKRELAKALVQFEHRPFGEFTEPLAGRN